jgi:hypothetical protein
MIFWCFVLKMLHLLVTLFCMWYETVLFEFCLLLLLTSTNWLVLIFLDLYWDYHFGMKVVYYVQMNNRMKIVVMNGVLHVHAGCVKKVRLLFIFVIFGGSLPLDFIWLLLDEDTSIDSSNVSISFVTYFECYSSIKSIHWLMKQL